MDEKKVIVIGIDGATFDIIYPLLQNCKLPNIGKILVNGMSATLTSVMPPITAPAWVSFMTGVNPGKHGIFDFISGIHLNGKEGSLLNSNDIRAKTIWEYLSEGQKKIISVGVPFTYPARKVNGVMVSLSMGCDIDVFPGKLSEDIIKNTAYNKEFCKPVDTFGEVPREEVLDEVLQRADYLTEKIKDISCYLLKKHEWNFFMAHFMSTDTIQHYFWHFIDSKHPAYDEKLAYKYGNAIYETYRKVDNAIGHILEQAGEDCNVIIVSDHGFAPIYKFFYVNKWLQDKGLLQTRNDGKNLYKYKIAFPSVYKILKKMGLKSIGHIMPGWLRSINIPAVKRCAEPFHELIDWKNTKAYASPFGINVNLKGREPDGIVSKTEYDEVRQTIKDELYKLRDSETGKGLIKEVLFSGEIYSGPYINGAADLFFTFKEPYYLQAGDVVKTAYFENLSKDNFATANHRYSPEGVLAMNGPVIKSEGHLDTVRLIDIAPTILYLLGLKIPESMDGRVVTELMDDEYVLSRPVEFIQEESAVEEKARVNLDSDNESEIKEHLRRLGYLG
jgi:predicted AlkP superfamily phosphohydrolase/phosphomutase